MKVPHQILGRTRPSSQGMDPLRVQVDPDAFGAGISRGLDTLAQGLRIQANQQDQRTEKLDRFQSMTNFSDFEISVNGQLAELKKGADPTGKGFVESANAMYDKAANEFIAKKIPPEMQEEARYWTSNTRQRIIGDSMNFQYEAGNAFFRAGVDKQFQTSLKALDPKLGGDPLQLPAQKQVMADFIAATDLSEIEKAEMLRTTAVGLEGVVYKQAVKTGLAAGRENLPGTIGNIIDQAATRHGVPADVMRRIAWIESKGNPNAKNPNSSAGGLFQQIDANAKQYGVNDRFDPAQSADGAARFAAENIAYFRSKIGRDPTGGEIYLMHQQGPGNAIRLLQNPDMKAVDIASKAAIRLNGGNENMTAREFAALWDRKLSGVEDKLDQSPVFANLPYEDRMSLRQDGMAEYNSEQKALADANALQVNTQINTLLNRINDGLAGKTEIDAARANGTLTDFADINRAQELYEKRNAEVLMAQRAQDMIAGKVTADPTSEDDRKALNAAVGKGGLAALDGMNQAYVTNGLIPAITAVGDIPTDVVGMLTGMVRSNNQSKALFAFETLAALQDADTRAFKNRIPDDLEADVNFYRMRRTALPADQLFEAVNGGRTPQERQGRTLLYQEAQDILKTKEAGVSTLSQMVSEVTSGFNGWTASAQQMSVPAFAKGLSMDYETAFTDAYIKYGDLEVAKKTASDFINNQWGVTAAGGVLMRNPPEKSGYPTVNGSWAWIDEQARMELALKEGERYELVSDDRTASEANGMKLGGPVPTYQVVVFDKDGVGRLWPERIYFEKGPAHFLEEERQLDIDVGQFNLKELEAELRGAVARGEMSFDDALAQQKAAEDELKKLPPPRAPDPKEEDFKNKFSDPMFLMQQPSPL